MQRNPLQMSKPFIILLFLLTLGTYVYSAQNDNSLQYRGVMVNLQGGPLLYHLDKMRILDGRPAYAFELSYYLKGNGQHDWHSFYGFPTYGVSYYIMNLGNTEELGYAHSLYPFIRLPIIAIPNKFDINASIGVGLAYISKMYDPIHNANNIGISTPLNIFIPLRINTLFHLTDGFTLGANFSLAHFSNGNIKKPNSGLNYIMAGLEGQFTLSKRESRTINTLPLKENPHRVQIFGYGFFKEVETSVDTKFPVATLSLEYDYRIMSHWRIGCGLDVMYDKSSQYILDKMGVEYQAPWQIAKSGITLNTELSFNRLSSIFELGAYTYNLNPKDDKLYQRVGLRYRFCDRFRVHLALKTHLNVADYIELGLGVRLI